MSLQREKSSFFERTQLFLQEAEKLQLKLTALATVLAFIFYLTTVVIGLRDSASNFSNSLMSGIVMEGASLFLQRQVKTFVTSINTSKVLNIAIEVRQENQLLAKEDFETFVLLPLTVIDLKSDMGGRHRDIIIRLNLDKVIFSFIFLFGVLYIVIFIALRVSGKKLERDISYMLNDLSQSFAGIQNAKEQLGKRPFDKIIIEPHTSYLESTDLIENFNSLLQMIHRLQDELEMSAFAEGQSDIAKQVAHDIRSPLSALSMVIGTLGNLPEEKRLLIRNAVQRINDIANNLLLQDKKRMKVEKSLQEGISGSPHSIELVSPLLDTIVSEKRIQFRNKIHIEIEADISMGYGLFVNIDSVEFKRIISNLINNSVEALPNKGKVIVSLRGDLNWVSVIVSDNGKGIPKEVLAKLGVKGVTHGKDGTHSGSGLGIYHAKSTIESFGGEFQIQSTVDTGTSITIKLPREVAPSWFVEKLVIMDNSSIVILDDDNSIHQIWTGRLQSIQASGQKVQLVHFSAGAEFENYIRETPQSDTLYLVDYELLNQATTGLDIIEKLQISKQSILVTSRYEESNIKQRCAKLNIRLIPKPMAGFVPIEVKKMKIKYHLVLLDDDSLIHLAWKFAAKEKNDLILCFLTANELYAHLDEIDPLTRIFIDSNLAGEESGEIVAKNLFDRGFKNLFLATGYDPGQFSDLSYLKGIVGKGYPIEE